MANIDTLRSIVEPIVTDLDAAIYDLEFESGTLKVTVDADGGIDLETVAEITRQVSRQLDLDDPIASRYTLEVTSPGLERNLRTPAHWSTATGERVRVKTKPHVEGDRRVDGVVAAVADDSVTIDTTNGAVTLRVDDVERARTVFEWGPQPKPGGPKPKTKSNTKTKSTAAAPAEASDETDPTPATMAADETGRGADTMARSEATVPSAAGHDPSKENA